MKRRIKLTNKKQLPLLWTVKQISFYMYFSKIYQPEKGQALLALSRKFQLMNIFVLVMGSFNHAWSRVNLFYHW